MTRAKKILSLVIIILLGVLIVAGRLFLYQPLNIKELTKNEITPEVSLPSFTEIPTPFVHEYKKGQSLAFAGGSLIDVNGDGLQEIFVGGGYAQKDSLLTYRQGKFVDIVNDYKITSQEFASKKRTRHLWEYVARYR